MVRLKNSGTIWHSIKALLSVFLYQPVSYLPLYLSEYKLLWVFQSFSLLSSIFSFYFSPWKWRLSPLLYVFFFFPPRLVALSRSLVALRLLAFNGRTLTAFTKWAVAVLALYACSSTWQHFHFLSFKMSVPSFKCYFCALSFLISCTFMSAFPTVNVSLKWN